MIFTLLVTNTLVINVLAMQFFSLSSVAGSSVWETRAATDNECRYNRNTARLLPSICFAH